MNYEEAIEYLESHINWEMESREDLRKSTTDAEIAKFQKLLGELDNPHLSYPTIHIAGTAGKGSTAIMLSEILTESGYKTGLYTSPHLISYTERIKIDNKSIPENTFADILDEVREMKNTTEKERGISTVFELLTTVAFLYFAREEVDIAIVEAGLGGRYDSTIVIKPVLTILTPIDLDHTDVLGEELADIAGDKSYSIREGIPAITEQWSDIVKDELERRAIEVNADLYHLKDDFVFKISGDEMDREGIAFSIEENKFKTGMTGYHQAINGGLAVVGASLLVNQGFEVSDDFIRRGVSKAKLRGRFEFISNQPEIILDGAHNPISMRWVSETLSHFEYNDLTLIIGMNEDKEIEETVMSILPLTGRVIAVNSSHPLAMKPEHIKSTIEGMGYEAELCDDIERALLMAIKDPPILITGSLYLVADYIKYFREAEI